MVSKVALVIKISVEICGIMGLYEVPKNRMTDRVFIIKMLVYSAKKNRANGPAAYSMLNPDTSSDSPSVRSNGARLVSARVETYHNIANGQLGIRNQIVSWARLKV